MPLHINLHHEIDQQDLARRRDPLRMGMLALIVIAVGFVVNYLWVLERSHVVNIRYESLEAEWSKLDPKVKAAKAREAELDAQIKASDDLVNAIEGRFYWAPILGEILKAAPREVQLLHVNAQSNPGDVPSTLSISGLSSGVEPRKEAEAVRIDLQTKLAGVCKHVDSAFKSLDDSDQYVMLDGARLATASFNMEFDLRVKDPVVKPAAAAGRKAKTAE